MSIAAYPKAGPKQRGRPKNSGTLKKPERKSTVPAKLSPLLIDVIQPERRHNESYSDTILRLLQEKGIRIGRLQKKVDALEEERLQMTLNSHTNTIEVLIN